MKFYLKMTLSMLALLSLLFGIGGSLLISGSFQNSLEREKVAAFGDYRMAWGTLQIVNSRDPYLDREAIARVMEQLYQQNSAAWASLRRTGPLFLPATGCRGPAAVCSELRRGRTDGAI